MTADRIVGIDLGTTNSLVAFMQGDTPVVIPGDDGSNLVPSVVALDENNQPVIGNSARRFLIETPERAVYSIKRLMGRGMEDIQEELKLFPFRLAEDMQPGEVLRIQLGTKDVHSAGNFGADPPPAQAERRALFRRTGHKSGDHGSGLFQRCTTSGHKGCWPYRRAGSATAGQ